ncbi:hypothetical protein [Bdellovibrio bacteriovorus]|uniref:Uncharacterized protein n=1 Tax=Bdellovibrio bacteriovorus str. Tiberius TaxID=1069642 RepID=K7Z2D1_BDEBC|nr:hypothetical protein [Bdellovibrio bacteriovorus]AFY03275.1 hypothetical protein Bdt_3600 [Bdellovibrio bacteriovorus str. Tiberius]
MKLKSLMVLSGLILSTTAAQADCFLDRASSYQCSFPKQITCTNEADSATGSKAQKLSVTFDDQGKVTYDLSTWIAGKCPSRNCGSEVQYTNEGSSDEPGKTGSVNNYNDQQLVLNVANSNGLEFLMILEQKPPQALQSFVAMTLKTLQVQGTELTGKGTKWFCH